MLYFNEKAVISPLRSFNEFTSRGCCFSPIAISTMRTPTLNKPCKHTCGRTIDLDLDLDIFKVLTRTIRAIFQNDSNRERCVTTPPFYKTRSLSLRPRNRDAKGLVKEIVDEIGYFKKTRVRMVRGQLPLCRELMNGIGLIQPTSAKPQCLVHFCSTCWPRVLAILHLRAFFKRKYLVN